MNQDVCLILDFGSQYTQLIARRVREKKVFSVIHPYHIPFSKILEINPKAIILSGSPSNVYAKHAPIPDKRIFTLGVPILGICYGLQLTAHVLKGRVKKVKHREYGYADLVINKPGELFAGLPKKFHCWMSHGDQVTKLPQGFERLARTRTSSVASFGNTKAKIYGVQFHPEVVHTPLGHKIIANFLFKVAKFRGNWSPKSFINETIKDIRRKVGKDKVVLGLSGGVDSSVAGVLIHKAIKHQLTCIFVDNGLLRRGERRQVEEEFRKHFHMNLRVIDATNEFLNALRGVTDPEKKRKIIGGLFIKVFEREAKKLGKVKFLAQGTLYPDVVESVSAHGGPTAVIKSHHNVGGLPKKMNLKLLEPLRDLFKDEVRAVGRTLGIKSQFVDRHPFPGPGLAVRILGEITRERLYLVREANWIMLEELMKNKDKNGRYYDQVWQAFAVLLPVKSVGVMGDERTYQYVTSLRAVVSEDGMTADWARLPDWLLAKISSRIINEVNGINRVCYDISSKPPATIEWE